MNEPVLVQALDAVEEVHGDVRLLLAPATLDAGHHHLGVGLKVH